MAVPPDLDRWNWGAILWNWIWGIGNNTYIALLMFVPLANMVIPFVLGAKGSVRAWRNKHWDSIEHFKRVQRLWALWGVAFLGLTIALAVSGTFALFALTRQSGAYQLAYARLQANQEAMEILGPPISTGMIQGSIKVSGPSGKADISFPVEGRKASGKVYLDATKDLSKWRANRIELEIDGRAGRIDLKQWRFQRRSLPANLALESRCSYVRISHRFRGRGKIVDSATRTDGQERCSRFRRRGPTGFCCQILFREKWRHVVPASMNIFLIYIPPGNAEAMVHYEDTIRQRVSPDRIVAHVSPALRERLKKIYGGRPIAVWGSRDSTANRVKFERMQPGDEILIVEGATIKLLGKLAATTVNGDLSRELWKPLRGRGDAGWNLIYFIANPQEINLPFTEFCKLMGYEENYQLRGFTSVSEDRLKRFYRRYDDLYSILMLIKQGQPVRELPQRDLFGDPVNNKVEEPATAFGPREDLDGVAPDKTVSDHIRMQWILLNLGTKAGSKVWIPTSDQGRIRDKYHFNEFEPDFAAGLDTQTRYVENIDVVWKEEFRIDAAFEIENSTAIYSGLLRFSDLTLVAPNTIYPLFIVAPREKRNRLIEQLRRPTFQKLHLDRKVRYLPYEAVEEVDRFFQDRNQGLTVDVIVGRSEEIHLHH